MTMNCDAVRELAPAFVLGALDTDGEKQVLSGSIVWQLRVRPSGVARVSSGGGSDGP